MRALIQFFAGLAFLLANSASAETCFPNQNFPAEQGTPEKQMAILMKEVADKEVFIRLIMAENLASGCASQDVADGIAWVLKNRVDAKNAQRYGIGRDVVFKDAQFRSSTGSCDVAKREVFLCPNQATEREWMQAKAAYGKTQDPNAVNPLPRTYQYFFFKHFDNSVNCAKWKGVVPKWATPATRVNSEALTLDAACIGFYK